MLPWSATDTAMIPDRSYISGKETTSLLLQQTSPLEGKGNVSLSSQSSEGMFYSCQSYKDPIRSQIRDSKYSEVGCTAMK